MYKKFNERYLKPDHFGVADREIQNKTIALFYGGVNVGKFPYVTHLRFSVLGESLKNILRKKGYRVISHAHTGDSYRYVGNAICAILHVKKLKINHVIDWIVHNNITAKEIKRIHAQYLAEGDAPNKRELNHEVQLKLYQKDPEVLSISEKLCEMEYPEIRAFYRSIMVDFDLWDGEKSHEKTIGMVVSAAKAKKILVENSSGKFVQVGRVGDKANISPVMLESSEGMHFFEACNMTLIYNTIMKYQAPTAITICHRRFDLTFKRIHRAISALSPEVNLKYLGVGVISKTDGKAFKDELGSRLPAEVFLDRLYQQGREVYDEASGMFLGFPIKTDDDFKKLVISVYKLFDLKHVATKDYRFPMDGFFSTEALKEIEILKVYSEVLKYKGSKECQKLVACSHPLEISMNKYERYLSEAASNLSPTYLVDYLVEVVSVYMTSKESLQRGEHDLLMRALKKNLLEVFTLLGIYVDAPN